MEALQKAADFNPEALAQRVAFLEAAILEKDAIVCEKTSLVSEQEDAISKLSAELQAERFKYAQLQRMIFGSKRERFASSCLPGQMVFEFEPKTIEIEQAVAQERESIRIAYESKKSKKAHQGRLALLRLLNNRFKSLYLRRLFFVPLNCTPFLVSFKSANSRQILSFSFTSHFTRSMFILTTSLLS
jgi:hypothetical protein